MVTVILYDFECECGEVFEDLVNSGDTTAPCPKCQQPAKRAMSAPHIQSVINDPGRLRESLAKRSHDHSVKEAKANPEKVAAAFGGKAASQARWNIRSHKSDA